MLSLLCYSTNLVSKAYPYISQVREYFTYLSSTYPSLLTYILPKATDSSSSFFTPLFLAPDPSVPADSVSSHFSKAPKGLVPSLFLTLTTFPPPSVRGSFPFPDFLAREDLPQALSHIGCLFADSGLTGVS